MSEDIQEQMAKLAAVMQELEKSGHTRLESFPRLLEKFARRAGIYPVPNFAVDLCTKAFEEVMLEHKEKQTKPKQIIEYAKLAYCATMPRLVGADNIRDFIACVANGMAIGLIPGPEGTRLLYAAQIAQTAVRSRKRHKKPSKSSLTRPIASSTTSTESVA